MFASIRCYFVHKVVADELVQRVDADFAQRISSQAGFISYEFLDCGGGDVMTISVFQEPGQAEASRQLAKQWTETTLQDLELTLTEALRGEILLRRSGPGWPVQAGDGSHRAYAAVRRYRLARGEVADVVAAGGAKFADRVEAVDGFLDYRILDCGGGQLLSISVFDNPAPTTESDKLAMQYVRDELRDWDIQRTDMVGGGEIVVSRMAHELAGQTHA